MYRLILLLSLALVGACDQENVPSTETSDSSEKIGAAAPAVETINESPEDVLIAHLEALKISDVRTAYAYLSTNDKRLLSYEEYKESQVTQNPIALSFSNSVSYEVNRVIPASENKATVELKVTAPEVSGLLGAAMKAAFSGKEQQEIQKEVEKTVVVDLPTTTKVVEYQLVEEADGWKVFIDAETKKLEAAEREKRSQISSKVREITMMHLSGTPTDEELLEKYNEILELDPQDEDALAEVAQIEAKLESKKLAMAYIPNVEVSNFEATRINTYSKKQVPAVRFDIKNNGDKTLSEVAVVVYFLDKDGQRMFEEKYYPVLNSSYSNTGLLKPNYSQKMDDGKYYTVDKLGDEWETGKAEIEVLQVEFAD